MTQWEKLQDHEKQWYKRVAGWIIARHEKARRQTKKEVQKKEKAGEENPEKKNVQELEIRQIAFIIGHISILKPDRKWKHLDQVFRLAQKRDTESNRLPLMVAKELARVVEPNEAGTTIEQALRNWEKKQKEEAEKAGSE